MDTIYGKQERQVIWVFVFYGLLCIAGFLFVKWFVPETKDWVLDKEEDCEIDESSENEY